MSINSPNSQTAPREFGWVALIIGACAWLMAGSPLPRIGHEARIEELSLSAVFGILTSIGMLLAVRAVRLDNRSVVAWLALFANVAFLVLTFSRIARWL
jgi:hypothetical protein